MKMSKLPHSLQLVRGYAYSNLAVFYEKKPLQHSAAWLCQWNFQKTNNPGLFGAARVDVSVLLRKELSGSAYLICSLSVRAIQHSLSIHKDLFKINFKSTVKNLILTEFSHVRGENHFLAFCHGA